MSVDHLPSLGETASDELPIRLLQRLVQLDSSNPPGNERACIEADRRDAKGSGIEPRILARDAARPNLVARIPGRGVAPPLLLHGHVDVVPAHPEEWRHPPFSAELIDGEIWGRGTLDMKGGVAMLVTAFLRAAAPERRLPAICSSPSTATRKPAASSAPRSWSREHAELFTGVRHALSEFGGYTQHVGGRRLYPIQVAQKRRCTLRLTVRGVGGHSASPHGAQATAKLGAALAAIERRRLPAHVTAPVRDMVREMAEGLSAPGGGRAERAAAPAAYRRRTAARRQAGRGPRPAVSQHRRGDHRARRRRAGTSCRPAPPPSLTAACCPATSPPS